MQLLWFSLQNTLVSNLDMILMKWWYCNLLLSTINKTSMQKIVHYFKMNHVRLPSLESLLILIILIIFGLFCKFFVHFRTRGLQGSWTPKKWVPQSLDITFSFYSHYFHWLYKIYFINRYSESDQIFEGYCISIHWVELDQIFGWVDSNAISILWNVFWKSLHINPLRFSTNNINNPISVNSNICVNSRKIRFSTSKSPRNYTN